MKNFFKISGNSRIIVIFILIHLFSCGKKNVEEIDPVAFANPPDSVKIYAWWHWMVNAISREGITRDLEAMKEQGIAGATILNVGGILEEKDYGVPQVIFGTDEWFGMFKWALQEADRLDLKIGAHNCDGWSTSGGPWIPPAMSMKTLVWSKTILAGGSPVDTVLLKPSGKLGYYEDIAVIAYRISRGSNSFQQAHPEISVNGQDGRSLYDGSPVSGLELSTNEKILIDFGKPFLAEKLVLHPRVVFSWSDIKSIDCEFSLSVSDDGRNFRPVKSFEITGVNASHKISFPLLQARFYALELVRSGERSIEITELELLKNDEDPLYDPAIVRHMDKIVSAKPIGGTTMFETQFVEENKVINQEDVRDVTEEMSSGGHLSWDPPEGSWAVLRFGYTTTGARNMPATTAGTGLECDKMDSAALNLHFNSFPAKLIKIAGPLVSNTFRYLFIDSWECGYQNWTKNFPQEFEKRRGYSILPWIPVLSGEIIQDNRTTEAFLHDFRLTIGELIEAFYYRHFAQLCEAQGMEFHAEVIYGGENYPPLKVLRSNQFVDLPMFEFWTNPGSDGMVTNNPVENTGYVTSAEAGHLYGKKIIPAEAYTGYAYYSEAPWDLKPFGDRAFCRGINRMVLHSYVHQPTEKKPGMTLGWFANHFNRHNTWWPHLEGWTTFQARVQYLLQQGEPVSDILYLVGDRMPQYQPYTELYEVPVGYKVQPVNQDILINEAQADGSGTISAAGQQFRLLMLPNDSAMDPATLQGIADLVQNGAILYGPPPSTALSLNNLDQNNAALKELTMKIWGTLDRNIPTDMEFGKGRVIWGESLASLIGKLGLKPDFEWFSGDSAKLIFIHKKVGSGDIYYVANQEDRTVRTECRFRVEGKTPEIWDPQYGTIRETALFLSGDGCTTIPVSFGPKESFLFVFKEKISRDYIVALSSDAGPLFPTKDPENMDGQIPMISYTENGFILNSGVGGDFELTTSNGHSARVTTGKTEVIPVEDEMEVIFGEEIPALKISHPVSWTELENPDQQYFSGSAVYSIDFSIPEGWLIREYPVYLSLGEVQMTARVSLNGNSLGTVWIPDYRLPVKGYLKEGENHLEIEVANVYRNRIIGDLRQYGKMENVWTTAPVHDFFNPEMELRSSGLLGPVEIIRPRPAEVNFDN